MNAGTHKYWAFISYSHADQKFAQWLQRSLERFHIPSTTRLTGASGKLRADKLAPVFRDADELPASADLGGRLYDALDHSRYLLVICSPSSAQSRWVDAEIAHFISQGREKDILLLVVDGEPGAAGQSDDSDLNPFPPSLRSMQSEPFWVDARPGGEARDRLLVRVAAGMLKTGFDNLWQRERRRRTRVTAIWSLASLTTLAVLGSVFWSQQKTIERASPERQTAAFQDYMVRSLRKFTPELKDEEISIRIVRTDNLNKDGLLDFFAFNNSRGWCGSGGCSMEVYVSKGDGKYQEVLNLFGHSSPKVADSETNGFKDITATFYMVDGNEPVYSVFQWDGKKYETGRYEFCDGVFREYCSSTIITPIEQFNVKGLGVRAKAPVYVSPKEGAKKVSMDITETSIVGKVKGKDWYLVQLWKSVSGFVRASDVTAQ